MCACVHVCMCRVAMQMGDTINQVLFYQGEGSQETSESDTFRSPATLYSPPTPPIKSPPTDLPCYLVLSGKLRLVAQSTRKIVWSSGLVWQRLGTQEPARGKLLEHSGLSEALKNTTEFDSQAWTGFGIRGLRMDHFVRAGNAVFSPAEGSETEAPGEDEHAVGLRWARVGDKRPGEGQQIWHQALAMELRRHPDDEMVEFSPQEWAKYGLGQVSFECFIRAGNSYWTPAKPEPLDEVEDVWDDIGEVGAGQVVGEEFALFREPRSFSLVASAECTLLAFSCLQVVSVCVCRWRVGWSDVGVVSLSGGSCARIADHSVMQFGSRLRNMRRQKPSTRSCAT